MARLSSAEKKQIIAGARRPATTAPRRNASSAKAYLEFVTFAARFSRAVKPVRFVGNHWRL
jgi:hypothetical protein